MKKRTNKISQQDDNEYVGYLTITKFAAGTKNILWKTKEPIRNKVVSSSGHGRNLIARKLTGDNTYGIEIDSAAVGDDNTAAADGNTGLGNALVTGIPLTNSIASNNVVDIDVFVADGNLPDDTYEEFGLFIGAQLFSRIVISPAYTKNTGEDTLFTYQLTLSG